jgi:hypothetical protein
LDTFKARIPSKNESWLVLSTILFLVNVWAIINILRAVPSWILSQTIWEMIGIISYPLSFALIESLIFLVALLILAILLPRKVMRTKFVAVGSLTAFLAVLGMIIAHLFGKEMGIWSVKDFGRYLFVILGLVLVSWIPLNLSDRFSHAIKTIAERISPLSAVYLILNIVAVVIMVVRNL